jgi:hypothetical protein
VDVTSVGVSFVISLLVTASTMLLLLVPLVTSVLSTAVVQQLLVLGASHVLTSTARHSSMLLSSIGSNVPQLLCLLLYHVPQLDKTSALPLLPPHAVPSLNLGKQLQHVGRKQRKCQCVHPHILGATIQLLLKSTLVLLLVVTPPTLLVDHLPLVVDTVVLFIG